MNLKSLKNAAIGISLGQVSQDYRNHLRAVPLSWLYFVLETLQADLLNAENTLLVVFRELFEDLEVVLTDFLILEHVDVERIS